MRKIMMVLACALTLAGCAELHLTQETTDVFLQVGSVKDTPPAQDYAGHFATYAAMAAKAYEAVDDQGRVIGKPRDFGSANQKVRALLSDWTYVTGDYGPLCPGGGHQCSIIQGLEYQVWASRPRKDGACQTVALVFRGTDANSLGDWLSDLHWIIRLTPLNDQYEQVQQQTQEIIDRKIKTLRCFRKDTQIVSVGHSLGGGLAQQAAYMSRDIRKVYAFDPSVVTGALDPHSNLAQTRAGLEIERIYEHGEILAFPRLLVRSVLENSPCNPQIRVARFNLAEGSPVSQHSIVDLAAHLAMITDKQRRPKPLPKPKPEDLRDCSAAGTPAKPPA